MQISLEERGFGQVVSPAQGTLLKSIISNQRANN